YLTSLKPEQGEQPDSDLRVLEFKKNNYGPKGESIALRYRNGLFLPEAGMSSIEVAAAEQAANDLFLTLLARHTRSGRNVSHNKKANNFAPLVFANEPEAKKLLRAKILLPMRWSVYFAKIRFIQRLMGVTITSALRKDRENEGGSHSGSHAVRMRFAWLAWGCVAWLAYIVNHANQQTGMRTMPVLLFLVCSGPLSDAASNVATPASCRCGFYICWNADAGVQEL